MKGCRTRQSGNLDTMGASKKQKFVVGAMEQGPIQNYHHQSTIGIDWRSCLQAVWEKDTIAYDLSGCSVALTQIQYKWKDDKTWESWQMWWRKRQGKGIAGRSQDASNLSRRVRTKRIRGANCVRYSWDWERMLPSRQSRNLFDLTWWCCRNRQNR